VNTIDVHAHYYPPEYVARLRPIARQPGDAGDVARRFFANSQVQQVPAFTGALADRVALLDRAGVRTQILSFASMNVYHRDESERTALVRAFNDGCAQAVLSHPGRFRFFASIPVPYVDSAITESQRVRALAGFAGFSLPTHIDGMTIDDPRLDPLYAEWNNTGALVLLHPDGFCARDALTDHSMEWGLGAPFEDTIAAVRLLRSGILERHPNLTWVVPHLGGVLPFVWHRLTWRWARDAIYDGGAHRQTMSTARLLLDTANSSAATLALAATALPDMALVFGSDYPFLDGDALCQGVETVRASASVIDPDRVLTATIADHLPDVAIASSGSGRRPAGSPTRTGGGQ
jgi:aminocarboxymuconate-semialdehyde decarboxylase